VPVPTWTVGEVLAAADVNTWFVPRVAYKTSAEHRSNTTLAADSQLTVPVDASVVYQVDGYLIYSGAASPADLKIQWNIPSGTIFNLSGNGYNVAGNDQASTALQSTAQPFSFSTSGSGIIRNVSFTGTLATAATAGSFALTWAQNTSSATDTIIFTGSYMALRRIG
jgi:hypothetical protein